ncbi:unnamed protein product [Sphenostylis stenocarpa]|uniref:Leucine-rich repeat-containing N-terminal plant-type domain-containing protein n=1 Tax=Sphenostylis stenocarpa TaxID=92480 RepID=A0AA86SQV7_9FABA|nr:unnamed protein product [Sphenostylis stenocarpa]
MAFVTSPKLHLHHVALETRKGNLLRIASFLGSFAFGYACMRLLLKRGNKNKTLFSSGRQSKGLVCSGFWVPGMYLSKGCRCEVVLCLWFCCYFLLAASQVTDPTEVEALRTIKKSLFDINGNLSSWDRGDPCTSNWTGVMCSNTTLADGNLHVLQLQLLKLNLSGTLAPEIGYLSYLEIMDFMWNYLSGTIPKEIGNIKTLKLLLLTGNKLTGVLPEELGHLPVLDRIQIDENNITGSIPLSFANLNSTKHFLLDNNNLTGNLPSELSEMPSLKILQLDNNNFSGSTIPESYANMSKLLKLSLRNCNLQGPIPDFSSIPNLAYLDLSLNQLNESIPTNKLSDNMTTIDLSNNKLNGTIPSYFSGLPRLQKLSIANNSLSGNVPSTIWQDRTLNATEQLILYMQYNQFTSISGTTNLPPNVTLMLEGNPVCLNNNSLVKICGPESVNGMDGNSSVVCPTQGCPPHYEYTEDCICAVPLVVHYRLKSPGFSDFRAYVRQFEVFLTDGLSVHTNQLFIERFAWEEGRLKMNLKLFPEYIGNTTSSHEFNTSEVIRIRDMFREWDINDSDLFGPYELLDFILLDPYRDAVITPSSSSGISKGALAGIVLGAIACAVTLSAIVSILILRIRLRDYHALSKRRNGE